MTNERAIIASDQISNRLRYTHGRRRRQTHRDTNRSHEHTSRNLVEARQAIPINYRHPSKLDKNNHFGTLGHTNPRLVIVERSFANTLKTVSNFGSIIWNGEKVFPHE